MSGALSLSGLVGLVMTSVVLIAIPGPTVMYLLGQALTQGRRRALTAVAGNAVGMGGVAVLVAFGLSALFARYEWVQPTLRVLGALVLALIGASYLRAGRLHEVDGDAPAAERGRRSVLATSVLVGFSNPKALVMFGAVVPSFVVPGTSPLSWLLVGMSAIPLLVGLVLDSTWVLVAAAGRQWFATAGHRLVAVNRVGGVLMLAMAAVMIVETVGHG